MTDWARLQLDRLRQELYGRTDKRPERTGSQPKRGGRMNRGASRFYRKRGLDRFS